MEILNIFNWNTKKKKKVKVKQLVNEVTKNTGEDSKILAILDQLKGQLDTSNLNIKRELYQLTNYFNKIPIIYAIINYDGRLIKVNDALTSTLTCVNKACIGTNLVEFVHPDDMKIFERFKKKLKAKNSDSLETMFRILSKSGKITYIKWGGVNLENDQMLMLFGQDITHEVDLSDKLKRFITCKKLILNNHPGAIVSINLNGTIIEFNKKAEIFTGYKTEEVVNNKHIFDIFPNKNLFDEDKINKMTKTNIKKRNGEIVESYILLLPLLNENKIKVGYLGICHDEKFINYMKSV